MACLQPRVYLSNNEGAQALTVPMLRRELGMKKKLKPGDWTRPEIKRLGTIKDVAQGEGSVVQGQPNRS